ncbi:MAG: class I SAM-dependent methyltransferase [Myxococcota bacterium]
MACLSCNNQEIKLILDLGETPLANGLLDAPTDVAQPTAPLRVGICEACSLVQLLDIVDREQLFDDYPYFSSVSTTVVDNAEEAVQQVVDRWSDTAERFAIEVASNDGYLLQHYRSRGITVLGIEPAANIAQVARDSGIPTLVRYFGSHCGKELRSRGIQADVIHAHNVLAHVDDLPGFVAGLRTLLKPTGEAIIEVPYVRDLVEHVEFDTIYHEHLAYFSVTSLHRLMDAADLHLAQVDRISIHGGSLRVRVRPGSGAPSPCAAALMAEERALGLDVAAGYAAFSDRVTQLCDDLRQMLQRLQAQGQRLAAYGASAKGTTLLHAAGIGDELLQYVVDKAKAKQGRYTPGTHLPIVQPSMLMQDKPDVVLLLSWNHKDEILGQQTEFRAQGGQFMIPVPTPHLV